MSQKSKFWLSIVVLPITALSITLILLGKGDNRDVSGRSETSPEKKKWGKIAELPNEWFYIQRAYPRKVIDAARRIEAADGYREIRAEARTRSATSPQAALNWQLAGPTNIPGRVTDIAVDPTDSSIIYVASAGAGVFKTTNLGQTWKPVFDEIGTYSMGAVTVDPNNPSVVYAGTGEINGRVQTYDGTGLYKSTDAGETWTFSGLPQSYGIGRILVDPNNSNIVYAAVMGRLWEPNPERGLYRSTDAGATWQLVLYLSEYTGCAEVIIHPSTGTLFAAMWERSWSTESPYTVSDAMVGPNSGMYRSTDGINWAKVTDSDLPTGPSVGRIGLTLDPLSTRVYAFIWTYPANGTDVYRSNDLGLTWSRAGSSVPNSAVTYRGYYFAMIKVAPGIPDRVYLGGVDLYRSINGGTGWGKIGNYTQGYIYADHHAMYIHPTSPNFILSGNDGGVYLSTNGGLNNNWQGLFNFPNTQFYSVAIDPHNPSRLYGGAQDRGTLRTANGSLSSWQHVLGGDGFQCLVDHTDSAIAYAEWQWGNINKSYDGGASFSSAANGLNREDFWNWNTPFVMDPNDHQVLYIGSHRLYRTDNAALSWSPISGDLTNGAEFPGANTITTIGLSAADSRVIYVGTGDAKVWVTTNTGAAWYNRSTGLPDRWVTRVTPDPGDPAIAYVTLSGYQNAEWTPHIFRTTNYGQNWISIAGNLPDAPINDIIIDPENSSRLYIATDFGVYYTDNLGGAWQPLGEGMPMQPILDLDFHQPTRQIVAATHGRSMYRLYLNCSNGADADSDGFADECDNCPQIVNADQLDSDLDGLGDLCDPCPGSSADPDGDLIQSCVDNCVSVANSGQEDVDLDGIGNVCDACPLDSLNDADHDGLCSNLDNCPGIANPGQEDRNQDGLGDACCCRGVAGNVDGDPSDVTDISDLAALIDYLYISLSPPACLLEANTDGQPGVDIADLAALIDYLYISFTPTANCQ